MLKTALKASVTIINKNYQMKKGTKLVLAQKFPSGLALPITGKRQKNLKTSNQCVQFRNIVSQKSLK